MIEVAGNDLNTIDLNRDDFFQNPYPYYAEMRKRSAPVWLPHNQNLKNDGMWLITRHADVLAVFKSADAFTKNVQAVRPPGAVSCFDLAMLHRDGADHLRLRRLVAEYFSPARLARFSAEIEKLVDQLIDDIQDKDHFDLLADLASPLPLYVIARLLGVPGTDLPQIRAWSLDLGDGFDSISATSEIQARQKTALAAFLDYIVQLLKAKSLKADDGLLSLLNDKHRQGLLTYDELVGMAGFLLYAGHENNINLIANGLWLLLSQPEQLQQLRDDPSMISTAIEEIVRFESPEQRTSYRAAAVPVVIGDLTLDPGDQIALILGSANRDETVFDQPDRFDVSRRPNRHLGFGVGIHHCIGTGLARLEGQIVLRRLLAKKVQWQPAVERPLWRRNSFFRAMSAFPAQQA